MPRKKAVVQKESPSSIEETPVVFFLKTLEEIDDDVCPAGHTNGYSDVTKPPTSMNYTDILKSMETTTSMSTDLLKSILDKAVCESYNQDAACFWCCHSFSWAPAILPISYDAYKNVYTCEGNFCSPECALTYLYNDVKTSDTTRWGRHTLLRHMYSRIYERRELSPAPSRHLLRMFGGPLDISQFRAYAYSQNDLIVTGLPPIRLVFPTMNIQGPLRDVKKYVSLSTDVLDKASQQLRMKRSKPIHTNIQTIDQCFKAR